MSWRRASCDAAVAAASSSPSAALARPGTSARSHSAPCANCRTCAGQGFVGVRVLEPGFGRPGASARSHSAPCANCRTCDGQGFAASGF